MAQSGQGVEGAPGPLKISNARVASIDLQIERERTLRMKIELRQWEIRLKLRLLELEAPQERKAAWPYLREREQEVDHRQRASEMLTSNVPGMQENLAPSPVRLEDVTGREETPTAELVTVPPKPCVSESALTLADRSVSVPRGLANEDALIRADRLELPLPLGEPAPPARPNANAEPHTCVVVTLGQVDPKATVMPRVGVGTSHRDNCAFTRFAVIVPAIVAVSLGLFVSRVTVVVNLNRTGNPGEYFPP